MRIARQPINKVNMLKLRNLLSQTPQEFVKSAGTLGKDLENKIWLV
jgi:hypothetical protein